jgi:zeta-carotene desaturase
MTPTVVVVGGGFAGLSAAVRLAAAGLHVVVVEEAPRLGGRATAFADRESGERVDNGQHVLFGCYRHTYAFLRAVGTETLAPLQPRLRVTMASDDGRSFELACPRLPAPWHLMAGVLRWRALSLRDRLSALRLRGLLRRVRRDGAAVAASEVPPGQTVSQWLREYRQSDDLCRWLWVPLAIAALNQSPETAAAAPFVRVLGELFGPRVEDSAVGVPTVPLDQLYAEPAAGFLEARSGRVLLKSTARLIVGNDGRVSGVRVGSEVLGAVAAISAVPWYAIDRIWDGGVPEKLTSLVQQSVRLENSPIVTVNLWFDGPVNSAPFVGLVDGPMHWMFDKSAFFGERAGHLAVVASGAESIARLDNVQLSQMAVDQLRRALPAASSWRLSRSVVVREHRATFSLAPGGPRRPPAITPVDNFYLAGDWTDTGLPGTIEGAVLSGHRAADLVLDRVGQHPGTL